MKTFKIHKNKKMPNNAKNSGRKLKYPFDALDVGDCFEVDVKDKKIASIQAQIASAGIQWSKINTKGKVKFTVRRLNDGKKIGVWRIK